MIGQKLYKYCATKGIFTYEVFGIITREQGNFLEVRCENCSHCGGKCELLICPDEVKGRWRYVQMLNNDGEYYWHKDEEFFFATKVEALKGYFFKNIKECEKKIKDHESGIKFQRETIEKYQAFLKTQEELENEKD